MRYPLKWALALNTYVAAACTAIITHDARITVALWCVAVIAVIVAVKMCFEERMGRGPAFGFVLGVALYFALACAVPTIVPPFQNRPAPGGLPYARGAPITWTDILQPANAIGVMVAGALGAMLGAVAFRPGWRDR
jgi:hypothetical protein